MTDAVTLFKSLPLADVQSFQKALQQTQEDLAISSGNNFLKVDKRDGIWRYGAEDNECQEGAEWAVNPLSLKTGYIAWGKGEVIGKQLRTIGTAPVTLAELPSCEGSPRGWEKCIAMVLACLNGEDKGMQVEYEQTSYGARKAFAELCTSLQAQIGVDPKKLVPVITLESDSYEHKEYGTIWNPIFKIKRWISMEGDAPAPVAEVKSGPTPSSTATPAPEVRRRRRPAVTA